MNAGVARAAIEALPMRDFPAIFGRAPLLILAPHADDKSLGCGGAIAEACARGHPVHVAILTDGTMSHPRSRRWPAARLAAQRRHEAHAAVAILGLGADRLTFLDQPDSRAPHDGPAFAAALEDLCALLRAHAIGTDLRHLDRRSARRPRSRGEAGGGGLRADRRAQPRLPGLGLDGGGRQPPADGRAAAPGSTSRATCRPSGAPSRRTRRSTSGMIDDDPTGFRLPPEFLAMFDRPWEAFLEPP